MKVLPSPGTLVKRISPPRRRAISRLMARPRPVPPYLRLVLPSACWKASKMICCFSGEIPIPVSVTETARTERARFKDSIWGPQPSLTGSTRSVTRPRSVNLKALESRFLMTCWKRVESVKIERGRSRATSMPKPTPLASATWRKVRST